MIILVITAHNAQETLPPLLAAVQVASVDWDQPYRALVIDDGSTDETGDIVLDFASFGNFELLRNPAHLGEGAALKQGLLAALDRVDPENAESTVIATVDSDNLHSPAAIRDMLPLLEAGYDVVVASHDAKKVQRRFGWLATRASIWLIGRLYPIPGVHDPASHCRAMRAVALAKVVQQLGDDLIRESSGACWLELTLKLHRTGQLRFAQVPHPFSHPAANTAKGVWEFARLQARVIQRCWRYR